MGNERTIARLNLVGALTFSPGALLSAALSKRSARFYDGRGYDSIDDLNGKFDLLPTAPQLAGPPGDCYPNRVTLFGI